MSSDWAVMHDKRKEQSSETRLGLHKASRIVNLNDKSLFVKETF
jgi:hypothetical protein